MPFKKKMGVSKHAWRITQYNTKIYKTYYNQCRLMVIVASTMLLRPRHIIF